MAKRITFAVNGRTGRINVDPDMPLLYALRNVLVLVLDNPKFGFGLAQCGACPVIMNGEAVRSCATPVSAAAGSKIRTIEGNIVMATSRALFEEVKFDNRNVTSLDWASYPILETPDVPEDIDIVLIDRPESPSTGAGEPSTRQVAPAIANAIFDATGKRLRRLPFTPERIRGLLG